jgi:hypothetical protein
MSKPASKQKQLARELHKQPKRTFRHRITVANGINDVWAADLVDMGSLTDRGFRYILTVIDVLSRHGWVSILKKKTKSAVSQAFHKLFEENNQKPNFIWTDRGREFNEEDIGVPLRFAYGPVKVGIVERFNKTLKHRMWYKLTKHQSNKWVDRLPKIAAKYNNTVHSTIGMTPNKAFKGGPEMEKLLLEQQHLRALKNKYKWKDYGPDQTKPLNKQHFKEGDRVRTVVPPPKSGDMFKKGYRPQWSTDIFVVNKVLPSWDGPYMYQIKSEDSNKSLSQHFYNEELQKTEF